MTGGLAWTLDAIVVVLVLVPLYLVWLLGRRRWVSRRGGTFDLSLRLRAKGGGGGWALGFGRYSGEQLQWFRVFSVFPRPSRSWCRVEVSFLGRRDPEPGESDHLYAGYVIARCETPTGTLDLALEPAALMGLLTWLEAAPPGEALKTHH